MRKILHIRGSKNYIEVKNNLLYNHSLQKINYPDILSRNKYFAKEKKDPFFGLKEIFLLWDSCLNVNYFLFRKKLRKLCIDNILQLNYFDTVLYHDEDYINYIDTVENNAVIFSQDDDDLILPNIFNLNIKPGLNVYLWNCIDLEKKTENITLTNQQNKRIKSSHYCNYYVEDNNIPKYGLVDHQFITSWINKNKIKPIFWDTYFNLYIRHPSSLTFLNNNILNFFYKHISLSEKEKLLKFHIKRCIQIMYNIKEKNKNIPILDKIYNLYTELL